MSLSRLKDYPSTTSLGQDISLYHIQCVIALKLPLNQENNQNNGYFGD